MIINRTFARASHATFTIPPIKLLLEKYNVGKGWIDPFAGYNSPAEFTNDLDDNAPTKFHLDALDFARQSNGIYEGVIFDWPYSKRQISEHYKAAGRIVTAKDTSYNFYNRVMCELAPKVKIGGIGIVFWWNSNGIPKKLGFETIEILLVAHGLSHNDTICTVQKRIS